MMLTALNVITTSPAWLITSTNEVTAVLPKSADAPGDCCFGYDEMSA